METGKKDMRQLRVWKDISAAEVLPEEQGVSTSAGKRSPHNICHENQWGVHLPG